jgi:hypothetical protein
MGDILQRILATKVDEVSRHAPAPLREVEAAARSAPRRAISPGRCERASPLRRR